MTATNSVGRASIARYYRGARTVHLERLEVFEQGDFLYYKPMYDFDERLARSIQGVHRVRFSTVLWRVLRKRYDVLEIAEPYTPSALPQNFAISLAVVLSSIRRDRRTRLVTYAIENADISAKLANQIRVPIQIIRPLMRMLVGFCFDQMDRIAYGTQAAQNNYQSLLGSDRVSGIRPTQELIWGLPSADVGLRNVEHSDELVFLGALDSRKGIVNLMAAWDQLADTLPNARLTILGKGPLQAEVANWASGRDRVSVQFDPERETIREVLSRSKALFLLSQPSSLWKEQIGLPIVEGLSFGLEIIASNESGISEWLRDNEHVVLEPSSSDDDLVEGIVKALKSARTHSEVAAALPDIDGRLEADKWLFKSAKQMVS